MITEKNSVHLSLLLLLHAPFPIASSPLIPKGGPEFPRGGPTFSIRCLYESVHESNRITISLTEITDLALSGERSHPKIEQFVNQLNLLLWL
ncbi:hypothetical protein [aff. Roholtiella sp. LEGE 12411]|uniref:hypothetical protein n=1 Tax=aff. Roholtiella sp. LEGE 12411 TaxID=1828822 RepID=UPI0019E7476B|nr:hypothetical protein [aff. Roholtiella sp. LEGE 12411]